jgi:hypothetical protein
MHIALIFVSVDIDICTSNSLWRDRVLSLSRADCEEAMASDPIARVIAQVMPNGERVCLPAFVCVSISMCYVACAGDHCSLLLTLTGGRDKLLGYDRAW